MALRSAFDPDLATPDRIDRVIQSWRLSTVLDFYLDRALRYGLVEHDVVEALRIFVQDLESGYTLSVRKMGLVFRLDSESQQMSRISKSPTFRSGLSVETFSAAWLVRHSSPSRRPAGPTRPRRRSIRHAALSATTRHGSGFGEPLRAGPPRRWA